MAAATTAHADAPPQWVLEPVLGPALAAIGLAPGRALTIGRLSDCQVQMPVGELTVSRRHCTVEADGEGVRVVDLQSRHGTFVNGQRLVPQQPRLVRAGDELRLGPWSFRLRRVDVTGVGLTLDDTLMSPRVVPVPRTGSDALDRRRLAMLLELAKAVQRAGDEAALAEAVVGPLLEGTGYARVAVIRPSASAAEGLVSGSAGTGRRASGGLGWTELVNAGRGAFAATDEFLSSSARAGAVDVLVWRAAPFSTASLQLSRTLIEAACSGRMVGMQAPVGGGGVAGGGGVEVNGGGAGPQTPSGVALPLMSLLTVGTTVAVAMPVVLDGRVALCLYLDGRTDEPAAHDDAPAFTEAVAELCALAGAKIHRARLEAERVRASEQMDAAFRIQRRLVPAPTGVVGLTRYALELRPGRNVAGDLFDILEVDARRVAFFIGDVSGKGLDAAILMATTQAYLHALLRRGVAPDDAMEGLNAHLLARAPDDKFVSVWLGVLDTVSGMLTYVDAGHGYWVLRGCDGRFIPPAERVASGPPLRVMDDVRYETRQLRLEPGARLVLFSDGVVEQPGGYSGQFGQERTLAALQPATTPEEDVVNLLRAVQQHARSAALADDLTAASILYAP